MKILRTTIIFVKSFKTMPGATPERVVASGVVCTHPVPANPHIRDFGKSENQRYLGQQKIQGTLGPSFALECKCAFGAIITNTMSLILTLSTFGLELLFY